LLIIGCTILFTLALVWLLNSFLFPDAFQPVELTPMEEKTLNAKIERLDQVIVPDAAHTDPSTRSPQDRTVTNSGGVNSSLAPEPYREDPNKRRIRFSEREINALLARNTDLADKLAIDLADNLASAKLLIPLDPDFPILGGKTLRVSAGLEIRYAVQKPVIKLRGVSVWGVPMPNAWLGGIKNVDLVNEFGGDQGFWQTFAAGVKMIEVREGSVFIELKE
jgi:hypothetical protein